MSLSIPRIIRSGYSSSVVAEAIPTVPMRGMEKSVQGNRCILKIGPRPELQTEIERYNQVVRFGVALEYRVELLGSALGDALGVVCYSFAGSHRTAELSSLQDLFTGRAEGNGWSWPEVLNDMFTSEASHWYSIRGKTPSLSEHFENEYRVQLHRCHTQFDDYFTSLARQIGVEVAAPKKKAAEEFQRWWTCKVADKYDLTLPAPQFLTSIGLSNPTQGCLSHGDLHGGNILVDPAKPEATFRFIDYRNSGLAPRLLDLSALQASIRLAHAEKSFDKLSPTATPSDAAALVAACFGRERALLAGRQRADDPEMWVGAALALDRARRVNFGDADEEEVLWTQFAYCLSLFRIGEMGWTSRLRLTVWLAALTERLVLLRKQADRSLPVVDPSGRGTRGPRPK